MILHYTRVTYALTLQHSIASHIIEGGLTTISTAYIS